MHNDKGREFQRRGAQMLKARDPTTVLTLGSTLTRSECAVRDWHRENRMEIGRLAGLQYFKCQQHTFEFYSKFDRTPVKGLKQWCSIRKRTRSSYNMSHSILDPLQPFKVLSFHTLQNLYGQKLLLRPAITTLCYYYTMFLSMTENLFCYIPATFYQIRITAALSEKT